MSEKCLVISRCEDEPYLQLMSQDEMMAALNDEWRDYKTVTEEQILGASYSFLEHFPPRSVLIMKGKLGKKRAVEQVVKWELICGGD